MPVYTGKLADYTTQPFPGATPHLTVHALRPGVLADGTFLATREIPVTLANNGTFTVELAASVDVTPTAQYELRIEWLNASGVPAGWSTWRFAAQAGGGVLQPGEAPISVWWVGPPWPSPLLPGFYFDKDTNDVGRLS